MPNQNAALGCAQLKQLPGMMARKATLAARYAWSFDSLKGTHLTKPREGAVLNHRLNALNLDRAERALGDQLLEALNDADSHARLPGL